MSTNLTRRDKLRLSSVTSIIYQIILIVSNLILPRLFIRHYGSEVNGLIGSITQFLSFITLTECGVGAVVQSNLYKPLAQNDTNQISRIFKSSSRFFRNVAKILFFYVLVLFLFYPLLTIKKFRYLYTATLVLAISISLFAQYYFGMSYRLLLDADQRAYVPTIALTIAVILNLIISIVLINCGFSVQVVKFISSLVFLLQPLICMLYVKKQYYIDYEIEYTDEPIKQKWNGFAQHLASVVLDNTDTVTLTLFSSLKNVSIYLVYRLIVNGLKTLIYSLTSGVSSTFGNMLANKEHDMFLQAFDVYEWIVHTIVTGVFTVASLTIVPFVMVYTSGVKDANYILPIFGVLITFAVAINCIRLPYNTVILAAGHYKQTQASAFIEALLNIFFSVLLVFRFALAGVAFATVVALTYRTIYLVYYLNKKTIFGYSYRSFLKHVFVDALCVFVAVILASKFSMTGITYAAWILLAVKVSFITIVVSFAINVLFYRCELKLFVRHLFSKG